MSRGVTGEGTSRGGETICLIEEDAGGKRPTAAHTRAACTGSRLKLPSIQGSPSGTLVKPRWDLTALALALRRTIPQSTKTSSGIRVVAWCQGSCITTLLVQNTSGTMPTISVMMLLSDISCAAEDCTGMSREMRSLAGEDSFPLRLLPAFPWR